MTQIKNNINTYADLTAYNADLNKDYPNVSYIQGTDEVKWVKDDPVHIVCVYNVTSTESATKLLNTNAGISYQIIDGVRQTSVQTTYTFDTLGKHIVKYKLYGTSIGSQAFYNCTNLTSVTIPDSVTSIGSSAFNGCIKLASVTIPSGVTSIGNDAFKGCTSLTSIIIPDSVTNIGSHAFDNCTNLTSVTIPDSVTNIGYSAFNGCIKLASVTIPSGVTSIDIYTFNGCSSLTNITIPDSVTSIGSSAFNGCIKLASVTIPSGVTSIGNDAFKGCTSLTSIIIPDSVTNIGTYAFEQCTSLTSIVVNNGNTKYDSRDNCNAIIETSTNTLIKGCNTTVIPDTVTIIYNKAFTYTTFKNVTIGDNVTKLNNEAFYDMRELESVTIGSGITSIGDRAFGMTNVYSSSKLTSITIYATTPPTLGEWLTTNRYNLTSTIYVPAESLEAYKTASNWKTYASYIQPIPNS